MRDAGHKARRILRKERRQCFGYDIGKFVLGDSVPHIEKEMAAPFQDAARLPIALNLVGKKHRAELTGHDIKRLILERQSERIGLSPLDPTIVRLPFRRTIEHRLIEIGRHDARLRGKSRCDRSCEDTRPGGRLQYILRFNPGHSRGEVARIRFENEGNQEPVIDFGDRSREQLVGRRHDAAPSNDTKCLTPRTSKNAASRLARTLLA
jgi:hypothetical protein